MEYDAIDQEEAKDEAYRYFMRVDPGMRDFLGPIRTIDDPVTGRQMRVRDAKIGMLRNTKPENMKDVVVYLDPHPHIRTESAKDLQGWYSPKHITHPGMRPRPCFTDAVLTQPFGGYCPVGCGFSMPAGELVSTPEGLKPIEKLQVGDIVWGRDILGTIQTKVEGTTKHWQSKGYVVLKLVNGKVLKVTADHPIYSVDRRTWVPAELLKIGERFEPIQAQDYSVDGKEITLAGDFTLETVTRVEGGLYVYDVQTGTRNFYQDGVLVHNCYINAGSRGYRGSGLMSVPLNYGAHVRKQLKSMKVSAAGYFSSFTDPFQPIESFYHNTQEGAKAFVEVGLPIFFLSRLSYPDWAFDLLKKNPHSYAQKSINTPDEEDWHKLSPGAISLAEHFAEIKKLRKQGIYVSIQVNPIVAGIVTHEDIEHLFELLAEAGANHVIVKFVEANIPWSGALVEKITKKFGDNRTAAFRDLFTENSCGAQRTINREYRLEGIKRYQKQATKLGLTFSLCYEFDRGTDGKWRSIGKDWVTSEQCHGHRVPMYTRIGDEFKPLEVCPPSGCLHCADDNDGEPRCGSDLLGQAKDLQLKDFRKGM